MSTKASGRSTLTVEEAKEPAPASSPAAGPGSAPPGARGIDTDEIISSAAAGALRAAGLGFCARYLALSPRDVGAALTAGEAQGILQAALALVLVQHGRQSLLSAGQGTADGSFAAESAARLGAPPGMNIFCDLEGVSHFGPQAVIDYGNAWAAAVTACGYAPGLYVGAGTGLTGDQLYHELLFEHYWRSMSRVPDIPRRGYQMLQLYPGNQEVCGVNVDIDVTQHDYKGGTVLWWSPPEG
ncbi:MAG: DUF1906 domain-containing protein [Polyangiaceae bacterium]|nr:DUF1906 domain-containing protein [Polyangiaceae bacterium]